jgi:hypothetical protein
MRAGVLPRRQPRGCGDRGGDRAGGRPRARSRRRFALMFILVFVTHVHISLHVPTYVALYVYLFWCWSLFCTTLPLTRFIPESLTYSVRLFLKRRCDRTPGRPDALRARAGAGEESTLLYLPSHTTPHTKPHIIRAERRKSDRERT